MAFKHVAIVMYTLYLPVPLRSLNKDRSVSLSIQWISFKPSTTLMVNSIFHWAQYFRKPLTSLNKGLLSLAIRDLFKFLTNFQSLIIFLKEGTSGIF